MAGQWQLFWDSLHARSISEKPQLAPERVSVQCESSEGGNPAHANWYHLYDGNCHFSLLRHTKLINSPSSSSRHQEPKGCHDAKNCIIYGHIFNYWIATWCTSILTRRNHLPLGREVQNEHRVPLSMWPRGQWHTNKRACASVALRYLPLHFKT